MELFNIWPMIKTAVLNRAGPCVIEFLINPQIGCLTGVDPATMDVPCGDRKSHSGWRSSNDRLISYRGNGFSRYSRRTACACRKSDSCVTMMQPTDYGVGDDPAQQLYRAA